MSAAMRGCLVLIVIVLVTAFVCIGPAFIWLPRAGMGVALPVITLPAEALVPNWPFVGYDFTNTLTSMVAVDVIILIIALVVGRALRSQPADQFVPRGFTNFIELLGEFLYNQAHKLLGKHTRSVFPLAASIFLFLLFANLLKLVPGYESVGLVACGEYDIYADDSDPLAPGQTSYAIAGLSAENANPGGILRLENASLSPGGRKGDKAVRADTLACEAQYPWAVPPLARAIQDRTIAAQRAEVENKTISRDDFLARARDDYAYIALAEALEEAKAAGEDTEVVYQAFDLEAAKAEFDAQHAEEVATEYDTGAFNEEEARTAYHARQLAKTQGLPGNPDRLAIVPFFRGLSTDLNVPLALALIVVLAVQVWGVRALGVSYFFKFINLPALGNMNKNPMGAIDFVVGLIEISSEISRLVSLTFRLFGSLFAGGILLVVFTFLVAFILPVPVYILELVIGAMQAYVFATLTIIYASQAVIGHHGDEHVVEHGEAAH